MRNLFEDWGVWNLRSKNEGSENYTQEIEGSEKLGHFCRKHSGCLFPIKSVRLLMLETAAFDPQIDAPVGTVCHFYQKFSIIAKMLHLWCRDNYDRISANFTENLTSPFAKYLLITATTGRILPLFLGLVFTSRSLFVPPPHVCLVDWAKNKVWKNRQNFHIFIWACLLANTYLVDVIMCDTSKHFVID